MRNLSLYQSFCPVSTECQKFCHMIQTFSINHLLQQLKHTSQALNYILRSSKKTVAHYVTYLYATEWEQKLHTAVLQQFLGHYRCCSKKTSLPWDHRRNLANNMGSGSVLWEVHMKAKDTVEHHAYNITQYSQIAALCWTQPKKQLSIVPTHDTT